uniref:glutaredoxin-like protein n=1 Tax=Gloiopeltis furcata TaxID=42017 RepID=UPI0028D7F424|nr:glutaredoxin-like protein [Gloiopeltis furcata]WMP13839.1 glutaredoxin-like protein [Gloiopeltis furcata]
MNKDDLFNEDKYMMRQDVETMISETIQNHKIVVFMKGERTMPLCGFSNTVVKILDTFNVKYHTVNVLDDEKVRQSIKTYSKWPTIPQVYINEDFIGGTDIILTLYQTNQLKEMLEKAMNS